MKRKEIYCLIKGELRLKLIDFKTYPLNGVSLFIGILIIIIPIALGLKNTGNIAQLITLIFLPLLTNVFMNTLAKVKDSTEKGVLEQCFNGSYSLLDIIIVDNIASIIGYALQVVVILAIVLLINPSLPMKTIDFIFTFLIIILNGFSFGLLLCGISLVHKKIGSLGNLISFLLLIETMLPIYLFSKLGKILFMLITPAGGILTYAQNIVVPDAKLNPPLMIALVVINTTIYLIGSLKVYNLYYEKARIRGTLLYY